MTTISFLTLQITSKTQISLVQVIWDESTTNVGYQVFGYVFTTSTISVGANVDSYVGPMGCYSQAKWHQNQGHIPEVTVHWLSQLAYVIFHSP